MYRYECVAVCYSPPDLWHIHLFIFKIFKQGIAELSKEIYDVGLKEKYMGEKIPQVWLKFEETIIK